MKMKILLAVILVILTSLLLWMECKPVFTPAIKDAKGRIIPNSISIIEEVSIGVMKQWIQIRGQDNSNPILLWLHGGPGSAQMPIVYDIFFLGNQ